MNLYNIVLSASEIELVQDLLDERTQYLEGLLDSQVGYSDMFRQIIGDELYALERVRKNLKETVENN